MHIHTHTHMKIYIHTYIIPTHTHMHAYVQAHTDCTSALNAAFYSIFPLAGSTSNLISAGNVCMYVCTCVCMYAHMDTRIHTGIICPLLVTVYDLFKFTDIHTAYIHRHTNHIHTQINTSIHTYIHAHIHESYT